MKVSFKQYVKIVLILTLALLVLPVSSLLLLDPLQIFHKPLGRDKYFLKELRIQAAGIINNEEFDSIILGTSIASNFIPSEASKLWNEKFVNISPRGAWLSERSHILNYALREKRLKHVIISLDGLSEYGNIRSDSSFDFLYNESRIDDLKIYLGSKYLKYLFCGNILSSFNDCDDVTGLESVAEWSSSRKFMRRFGGLDKWIKAKSDRQIKQALEELTESITSIQTGNIQVMNQGEFEDRNADMESSIDNYIFKFVRNYPDTTFYLFFPPFSRMKYALWKQAKPYEFKLYVNKIRYVAIYARKYSNVRLFGFDHLDFLDKIENYRDTVHFHPAFNSKMLKWMHDGKYLLSADNVEEYVGKISRLADDYDILSLGEEIKRGLQ